MSITPNNQPIQPRRSQSSFEHLSLDGSVLRETLAQTTQEESFFVQILSSTGIMQIGTSLIQAVGSLFRSQSQNESSLSAAVQPTAVAVNLLETRNVKDPRGPIPSWLSDTARAVLEPLPSSVNLNAETPKDPMQVRPLDTVRALPEALPSTENKNAEIPKDSIQGWLSGTAAEVPDPLPSSVPVTSTTLHSNGSPSASSPNFTRN